MHARMALRFRRDIWRSLAGLFSLYVAITSARAQSTTQSIDQAALLRTSPAFSADPYDAVTGTDSGHAAASPNDPDLGEQAILKRQERYRAFTVSLSAPFFYTSNVALTRSGEVSDFVFAPGIAVSYAPHLTKTLYGTFSVGQQEFLYDRNDDFNFGSFEARAGLNYQLPQAHDLLLQAEYCFSRLTSDAFGDAFYSNHSIFFSAQLPFRIGRAQQFALGAEANISLVADPEQPRRHDVDVFAGYSANLTRSLTVTAVARLAVRDYVQGDRTDVSEILALTATYRFTKWLSASATSTLAASQSNHSVFDYEVANLGAAMSLGWKF
jgi:opacity protein-like surface antigen